MSGYLCTAEEVEDTQEEAEDIDGVQAAAEESAQDGSERPVSITIFKAKGKCHSHHSFSHGINIC